MGRINNVWNRYLRDTNRFADLFNGVFFGGKQVVKAEELVVISETYEEPATLEKLESGARDIRVRDILMASTTGTMFRLFALENQELVNYGMPFRCMQYDTMEYSRQINEISKKNEKSGNYDSAAERLGMIKKSDRLTPVYTLCVYHGEEPWDGPRSLKDMMDFGDDSDAMSGFFADYPMRLFCINERKDFTEFHSEIRKVFHILKFRKDREQLKRELETNEAYKQVDIDSVEVMAVMLKVPEIWENREKYIRWRKGGT